MFEVGLTLRTTVTYLFIGVPVVTYRTLPASFFLNFDEAITGDPMYYRRVLTQLEVCNNN